METRSDMWTHRDSSLANDLTGFSVEATDGGIGKVDEASNDVGASYIVVDTGMWIFGKKVLLPAGTIQSVDPDTETVFVNKTKDEIKDAPEFDPERYKDESYRSEIGNVLRRHERARRSALAASTGAADFRPPPPFDPPRLGFGP